MTWTPEQPVFNVDKSAYSELLITAVKGTFSKYYDTNLSLTLDCSAALFGLQPPFYYPLKTVFYVNVKILVLAGIVSTTHDAIKRRKCDSEIRYFYFNVVLIYNRLS